MGDAALAGMIAATGLTDRIMWDADAGGAGTSRTSSGLCPNRYASYARTPRPLSVTPY